MNETRKLMKSILTGKEGKVNEKELIEEYQEKLSPNILAYFYTDNFGIIQRTSLLYPILSNEDKASFCLQELDKCLLNYKINSNAKFITYFIKCYKNRLRTEVEAYNTQKRKIILNIENIVDTEIIDISDLSVNDKNLILQNYDLSSEEIKQCKLLDMGYTIKEIAKLLKLTPITIYRRNNIIKQKILNCDIKFA